MLGITTDLPEKLNFTGDEPRYLLYALSLNLEGKPVMSDKRYEELRNRPGPAKDSVAYPLMDIQGTKIPSHPILFSLLLAPFATSLPLQDIRLVALLSGLIGLWFLARLLLSLKLSFPATIACFAPAVLFLPTLPYYFLALPEILLFALVCISFWSMLSAAGDKLSHFYPAIICSCLAPFVHVRGLPLSVAIAAYLIAKFGWRRSSAGSWSSLLVILGIYCAAGAVFSVYNQAVYGHVFGSVTTARPLYNLDSLSAIFFNWRHGLLTYAPLYVLSFAGLIAGLWQRQSWAVPCGIFLVGLVGVSAGPDPGECFPARFWVQGTPVLAICLVGFTQGRMPAITKAVIYGVLSIVSVANSVLFFWNHGLHLAARSGPSPYDYLFDVFPWIHLGFWGELLTLPNYRPFAWLYIFITVAIVAAASIHRSRLLATVAAVIILLGLEMHRARPIKEPARIEENHLTAKIGKGNYLGGPVRIEMRQPWKGEIPAYKVIVSDGTRQWVRRAKNSVILNSRRNRKDPFVLRITSESSLREVVDADAIRIASNQSWLLRLW